MSFLDSIVEDITDWKWRLAAVVGVAGTIGFGVWCAESRIEIVALKHQVAVMDKRINAVPGGLVADLAQAQTNGATCEAALKKQNAAIAAVSTAYQTQIAAAKDSLVSAQEQRQQIEQQVGAIMSGAPVGTTVCARVQSVDDMILKDLKNAQP